MTGTVKTRMRANGTMVYEDQVIRWEVIIDGVKKGHVMDR